MYSLILADDEADVRDGVLQEIDWGSVGFQVVDRAENGREAWEKAKRWRPEVIVTDIRMPFMDGLELAELVKSTQPDVKIIILTGYDEFEYARKAIRLGIEDIVMKPFSAEELLHVLHKVKASLDDEREYRQNLYTLREHYRSSLPLLRELFLGSLITRSLNDREIGEKLDSYDLSLHDGSYLVAVLKLDLPSDAEDVELRIFAVRNIAEELVERQGLGYVFQHAGYVVVLFYQPVIPQAEMLQDVALETLEEVRESVEKYLKLTVTVGVGTQAFKLRRIRDSFRDAVTALDYRMLLGTNRIIPIKDVEARTTLPFRYDEQQEQALLSCLKVGTPQELTELVEKQFSDVMITGSDAKPHNAQLLLLHMISTLMKAAQDTGQDPSELFGGNGDVLGEVAGFHNLTQAKEWVLASCLKTMSKIASDRQTSYNSLVEQAKAYTRQHYGDCDLSIAAVCAHLHISMGYFSSIFKKETKLTYVNYLIQLRMETAKELLLSTDSKAFEIAEKVGYADPNYFSFSFKKYVGLSPKDYRGRVRGGAE